MGIQKKKKKIKDISRSQKRCGVMEMGSGEKCGSLGGEGGIKNRRAFWWDVIWFLIDTRPSLIGLRRESDGSQAQLSLDQIYADVSLHHQWPFWKWRPCYRKLSCWTEQEMTVGLQKSSYQPDSTCHNLFSMANRFFIKTGHKGIQQLLPGSLSQNIHFTIHFIASSYLYTSFKDSERMMGLGFVIVWTRHWPMGNKNVI